jgi:hypothetical protein
MTQCCTATAGQHSCEVPGSCRERREPNGVNAPAVKRVQRAGRDPAPHRRPIEPKLSQLRTPNHPVLAAGQGRDGLPYAR